MEPNRAQRNPAGPCGAQLQAGRGDMAQSGFAALQPLSSEGQRGQDVAGAGVGRGWAAGVASQGKERLHEALDLLRVET